MRKILIATISEATNTALADAMSQYEVHICTTGPEALALLETIHPDIMILDLMLPFLDGLAVLRESRYRPSSILARTNLISATILHSAAAVGVQDVLLIPCTIRYVVERLDALIEKSPSPEL